MLLSVMTHWPDKTSKVQMYMHVDAIAGRAVSSVAYYDRNTNFKTFAGDML